jgi:hypothetical protein
MEVPSDVLAAAPARPAANLHTNSVSLATTSLQLMFTSDTKATASQPTVTALAATLDST